MPSGLSIRVRRKKHRQRSPHVDRLWRLCLFGNRNEFRRALGHLRMDYFNVRKLVFTTGLVRRFVCRPSSSATRTNRMLVVQLPHENVELIFEVKTLPLSTAIHTCATQFFSSFSNFCRVFSNFCRVSKYSMCKK